MRRTVWALWILWLATAVASPVLAQSAERATATVFQGDGREGQIRLKKLAAPDAEWFLSGSDLADLLGVGRYWRLDVRKLVLRVGDDRITFTAGARTVVVGQKPRMLRHEVVFHEGQPWIPLEFVVDVLPELTTRTLAWDPEQLELRVGQRDINVLGLEIKDLNLATEVWIRLRSPLAFQVDEAGSGNLQMKVYGAKVDPADLRLARPQGLIDGVVAQQESGYALISIRLSELVTRYQSLTRESDRVLVLRVEQAPITTIPSPAIKGPKLVQTLPKERTAQRVRVRRVIIDPGHGGADLGRKGLNGLLEKDVTLDLARALERELDGRQGIEVVLTREGDETLSLVQRTERANRERADLFLSIHCNGWFDRRAEGAETYFLSPAKTDWDKSVAQMENASDPGGNPAADAPAEDLDFILWDLVQNRFIQESAILAEAVQNRLTADLGMHNRGVKQAGFRVLVGAYMPAVLVEVGFLSNPGDAALLGDPSFHQRVAKALAGAVLDFRARMEAIEEDAR